MYKVHLTRKASSDLAQIADYIEAHDSPERAVYVFNRIETEVNSLGEFPERGTVPKELRHTGGDDILEVFFKPYRIIYTVIEKRVYVILIADGRRNMLELLDARLLNW